MEETTALLPPSTGTYAAALAWVGSAEGPPAKAVYGSRAHHVLEDARRWDEDPRWTVRAFVVEDGAWSRVYPEVAA